MALIAIDFDGTCVSHNFPKIGKDIGAVPVLKELVKNGHKLILYTMRDHNSADTSLEGIPIKSDTLQDAINWFKKNNIPLYGINENPSQKSWTGSPKPYANIYIDDSALGVPLIIDSNEERPYVDWKKVAFILYENNYLSEKQLEKIFL